MSTIISRNSQNRNTALAFEEVVRSLHSNPSFIIFFASTIYTFEELTNLFHQKYPSTEVVGLTTTGEIGPKGFSDHGLSVISFSPSIGKVKGILIDNIEKYPVFYRNELKKAATDIGINLNSGNVEKEGLGLVFPNGIIGAEEKMLSIVNSIFKNDGFPLFGGTAGDDIKFVQTYVSLNGQVSSKGGIVVFMKPLVDIYIWRENIFESTGIEMTVTKVDSESRTVYEFDGEPAARVYANKLKISEKELPNYFMSNPIGRKVNDKIYIASPFKVLTGGAVQFYCEVFPHTKVEILKPKDPVGVLKETIQHVHNQFSHIDGVVGVNCILRTLQFQNQNLVPSLNKELEKLPNLAGFISYGEQLNKMQLNQTLILLSFGKRK